MYSHTITAAGQYLPTPAPGTMPTCPHPTCPCAHRNIAAEALLNHVQSSPWASLYFCATCKCVCKSESVLHHVGTLLRASEYLPCWLMDGIVAQAESPWYKICYRSKSGPSSTSTRPVVFSCPLLPSLQKVVHYHQCARAALPRHSHTPKVRTLQHRVRG